MFVVCSGEVEVVLEPKCERVATLSTTQYFGEMSLLTGAARSATVRAITDAVLMEITAESFRHFVLERPAVLEQVSAAAVARRAGLDQHRHDMVPSRVAEKYDGGFLARARRFLGLDT
jgi:CRP-like cAMP-binding protein